jgi:hypothetical protein
MGNAATKATSKRAADINQALHECLSLPSVLIHLIRSYRGWRLKHSQAIVTQQRHDRLTKTLGMSSYTIHADAACMYILERSVFLYIAAFDVKTGKCVCRSTDFDGPMVMSVQGDAIWVLSHPMLYRLDRRTLTIQSQTPFAMHDICCFAYPYVVSSYDFFTLKRTDVTVHNIETESFFHLDSSPVRGAFNSTGCSPSVTAFSTTGCLFSYIAHSKDRGIWRWNLLEGTKPVLVFGIDSQHSARDLALHETKNQLAVLYQCTVDVISVTWNWLTTVQLEHPASNVCWTGDDLLLFDPITPRLEVYTEC